MQQLSAGKIKKDNVSHCLAFGVLAAPTTVVFRRLRFGRDGTQTNGNKTIGRFRKIADDAMEPQKVNIIYGIVGSETADLPIPRGPLSGQIPPGRLLLPQQRSWPRDNIRDKHLAARMPLDSSAHRGPDGHGAAHIGHRLCVVLPAAGGTPAPGMAPPAAHIQPEEKKHRHQSVPAAAPFFSRA
ncbi:hypothetical protein ACFSSC_09695 [Corynebacterium mendelii]|uniref:Uncharacterized protein n=1 Tax=Corynebacterium mendelii TaxID=2765362 RepID=A0A939E1Z3_9CORY|nr:hypothetical protein [Corynebacterium mendelii]MBN9645253.1 hypothetical protein [Corynebacterium mendelii]